MLTELSMHGVRKRGAEEVLSGRLKYTVLFSVYAETRATIQRKGASKKKL